MSFTSSLKKRDLPVIWPAPLQPGDLVAVVAPASPVAPDLFAAGAAILEGWGLRLRYGPELFAPRPYRLEADMQAGGFFQEALTDSQVRGIICARGGYGAIRLLEHLDPLLLIKNQKYIMGFSDITNLFCLLTARTGVVTFHGPTVAQLGEVTPAAREQCRRMLLDPAPDLVTFPDLQVLAPGHARGRLLGGNLTTLCHLLGTPYAPSLAGHILFLEDHNEAPYRLDRLLQQLRLSGSLCGLQGVVLGSFTCCGDPQEVWEVVSAWGESLGIPILAGLPAGHQPENFTLPLGAPVLIDGDRGMLSLAGKCYQELENIPV